MKRGILINLVILFLLVTLVVFPVIVFWITDLLANANNCDLSIGTTEGYCGSLYTIAFVTGLFGMVSSPILLILLGIYLLAVIGFSFFQWRKSNKSEQPLSPVIKGMYSSTIAVIGLATIVVLTFLSVNWYQVSYLSACRELPQNDIQSDLPNGSLAVAVKLPEPQGTLEQYRIFSISPQGELQVLISNQPGSTDPEWSPDGRKLAYVARSAGKDEWHLMLTDRNGQESQTILKSDLMIGSPSWGRDENTLFFHRWLESSKNPDMEVFRMDLETGNLTRLPGSNAYDGDPRVSPDGFRIIFVSERGQSKDIYIMNQDGSDVARLTRHPSVDTDPYWSPDGQWIVFSSNRNSSPGVNNYNLYIMEPDGSNQCQLTDAEGSEWRPAWSPDGQWIAYVSLLERKIFRIRPNGSEITPMNLSIEISDLMDLDWAVER